MNHDQSLESPLSTQPPSHGMPPHGKVEVSSADDGRNPDVIGEIKPEHPIAIDTVFRRIMLYLDCADLISCSQIWWNCYQITKEIFRPRSELTIHWLNQLKSELAKTTVQNIGHLTFHRLYGFYDYDPGLHYGYGAERVLIKLVAEHPKLKYLTKLTFNDPSAVYLNMEIFHNLLPSIGQRLQVLCIKEQTRRIFERYLPTDQDQIFPISKHGNREAGPQQQLLECKNMKILVLDCCGMMFSINGIALTFPNLVELYLEGLFGISVTDKLQTQVQMPSKQQAKVQVPPQQPSPQQSRPQLLNLRKLSIIYEPSHPPCAHLSHLSVLTATECKNIKRLVLHCCYGMTFSITGIALKLPNLIELYLKGNFGISVTDKLQAKVQIPSKQQAKGQVPKHQQPSPQQSRPQLLHLEKLSIIYEPAQLRCAKSHLSVLTAMELQLKHLELVNVLNSESIVEFLGTQSKTLETLKLTTTPQNGIAGYLPAYPTKLPKFFLPGKFLKLQEITLAKLFINDKFQETLKAIPNATKITFQLMPREIWENILQRTNLTKSDQHHQPTVKVNTVAKTKNSKMPQPKPKAMPPKPTTPTTHNNIKEIYITGPAIISESSFKELKQIFPNCVNISLNSSNIQL